jgi:hypothetical protein
VVQNMISFKSTIMLNVLLPPIILASGYDLKEVQSWTPAITINYSNLCFFFFLPRTPHSYRKTSFATLVSS